MKIEQRTAGEVHVLDCSGKITLGDGTMMVRNTVREIVQKGGKKILLNLADVPYIDSSGVGELVSSFTTVTGNGGQLKLVHLTPKTRELLTMTKLLTVFQVYDNEQSAVASFA
jgi:anti-sigma B factor antagonist